MKQIFYYCLLGLTLGAATGCQKDADATPEACAPGSPVVQTLANADGIVIYSTAVQQYVVEVPQPTMVDMAGLGVCCTPLPASLQATGTKVRVSGVFRQYGAQPANQPAGYTYYHLEASQLTPR